MRPHLLRRIAVFTVLLVLCASFLTAVAERLSFGQDPASQLEQEIWAGRRKSTPTPKPPKTPKPAATPTPREAATPTPAPTKKSTPSQPTLSPVPAGPIIEPQAITDWLFSQDFTLPDNFITKDEARNMGWGRRYQYVSEAAPGKSIGGDRFWNLEGLLPEARGRQYFECDCYYREGSRNAYRIIFSNDGLVFYSANHYKSFVQMFPSGAGASQKR